MIIVSEVSQRQIPHDITYMWNLKKKIHVNLLTRETQTHTIWWQRGEKAEGLIRSLGLPYMISPLPTHHLAANFQRYDRAFQRHQAGTAARPSSPGVGGPQLHHLPPPLPPPVTNCLPVYSMADSVCQLLYCPTEFKVLHYKIKKFFLNF